MPPTFVDPDDPIVCPGNLVLNECGTCLPTCDDPWPEFCIKACIVQCECPNGDILSPDGTCGTNLVCDGVPIARERGGDVPVTPEAPPGDSEGSDSAVGGTDPEEPQGGDGVAAGPSSGTDWSETDWKPWIAGESFLLIIFIN